MSDKPKVYQGVRVKTTVKELLQKRRALQAEESRKSQTIVPPHDVCPAPLTAAHLDIFSGTSAQDSYFQPRQLSDNVHISMEDTFDNQFLMNMIPSENLGSSVACSTDPSQWPHECIPSCTDYYSNSFASSSPTHSFNLPSPIDYNSYSPPESHSSSSSCYSSPTRMDMTSRFLPEGNHYQHCNVQHCSCLPNWPSLHDGVSATDHAPYSASDCFYSSFGEDGFCRRDSSGSELCYL